MESSPEKRLPEVVLDSSFLASAVGRVDVYGQLRELVPGAVLVVLGPVLDEVEKLGNGPVLIAFINRHAKLVPAEGFADKAILEYAKRNKAPVATHDADLKAKLLGLGIPVIYLRAKKKCVIEGAVF
jgi:rRNA-processing protein FCF1